MQNQKILVTGGAGFIGSHLVDKLIELENDVYVIDNLLTTDTRSIKSQIEKGKCKFIKKDLRDAECFKDIPKDFDYIFHLAADPNVKTSVENPINSFNHNVLGTINLLEFTRKIHPKGFIFASSGGTLYGDVENFPITENDVLKPISPYGASKAACEMYISAYANAYQFKAVSGRYANIFGERSTHGVTYDFYYKLKKNPNELEILGNGKQKKSYLHVSDCVEATILIGDNLMEQRQWYDYYNIGSEDWVTVDELALILEEELGLKNVKHKYTGGEKGWIGDVHKLLLSIEKIKKLGWKPKVSFKEAVRRYVKWLKNSN
ncbi:MAG: GDP-mannose 4,6-dehydratase [Promethearchaeota archaeon]